MKRQHLSTDTTAARNSFATPSALRRALEGLVIVVLPISVAIFGVFSTARADAERTRPQMIAQAMPAVTMILAVEETGKRLKPISSGSGTIIESDGSILTNVHVLVDKEDKTPHDLFVVARYRAADQEPEMVCAGRPDHGKLNRALDLALIKCDRDMNLRPFTPKNWPTMSVGRSEEMIPGERILVLGYPNVGGGTISVTRGLLSGWMREDKGSSYRSYMKTDAAITHGHSGGAAMGEDGKLVGVPTAFRVTTAEQGEITITAGKVGLIRPIEHARDLLAIANTGWTPSADGDIPEVDPSKPNKSDDRADGGVRIASRVVAASNRAPVGGAVVVVFKVGISTQDVDLKNLESQALTWGRSDADGRFALGKPVPRGASYTVAVIAKGFEPLIANDALVLPASAPSRLDPWQVIRIERN